MVASVSRTSSEDLEAVLAQNMNAVQSRSGGTQGGARRYPLNEANVLLSQGCSERLELGGAD